MKKITDLTTGWEKNFDGKFKILDIVIKRPCLSDEIKKEIIDFIRKELEKVGKAAREEERERINNIVRHEQIVKELGKLKK